ncbi:unnamed protein product [Blepharisma stoltei]|uniref:Uncharacterized protein n=1 Tax=Blepharisma stoltei TaxID=1481888 RepID=A0AAU9J4G7_9CILI|nr:unnamed protein product [Blepharisma stoltei]
MEENPISEYIWQREIKGFSFIPSLQILSQRVWNLARITPNHSIGIYKPESPIIFLKSKASHLITVDKLGRCIYHSAIPNTQPFLLTAPFEICFKAFFLKKSLILLLRHKNSELMRFYSISLNSLEERSDFRTEIFFSVQILYSFFDQIDCGRGIFTCKTVNEFQVWNITTGRTVAIFPMNTQGNLKYSNGYILVSKDLIDGIFIEIYTINSELIRKIKILGLNSSIEYEINNGSLMFLFWNKIFAINYTTCQTKILCEDSIVEICGIEGDDMIVNFSSGKLYFLSNFERFVPSSGFSIIACSNKDLVIVFDKVLKLAHIINKEEGNLINTICIPKEHNISVIGINKDTHQIFLGTKKGQIILLE